MHKKGILLVNLGTPEQATPEAVYRYLKEFLNDPFVVDLPAWVRWPLVNLIILPFRYKTSTHAYQQIWESQGSPLLTNSLALQAKLAQALGTDYQVELGMRYGKPSIATAMQRFNNIDELTVLPLFPQYSQAASGSAIQAVLQQLRQQNFRAFRIVQHFYQHPPFIEAYAQQISQVLQTQQVEMLIFSYHGLPEQHVKKTCRGQCDRVTACPFVSENNHACYRAQCYTTARLIADRLKLNASQFSVSFQSRLGRTSWIKPYTDHLLTTLRARHIAHIAVVCPSFVSDCLETLEEINIRLRATWNQLGGQTFTLIPALNTSPAWVNALTQLVT